MEKNDQSTEKRTRNLREFALYCAIGALSASLDFVVFAVLMQMWPHYQVVNIVSVSLGITASFLLNAFLNFKVTDTLLTRFLSFYAIGILGLGLSALLLFGFVQLAGVSPILAKLLSIPAVVALQFTMNKYISFRRYG